MTAQLVEDSAGSMYVLFIIYIYICRTSSNGLETNLYLGGGTLPCTGGVSPLETGLGVVCFKKSKDSQLEKSGLMN